MEEEAQPAEEAQAPAQPVSEPTLPESATPRPAGPAYQPTVPEAEQPPAVPIPPPPAVTPQPIQPSVTPRQPVPQAPPEPVPPTVAMPPQPTAQPTEPTVPPVQPTQPPPPTQPPQAQVPLPPTAPPAYQPPTGEAPKKGGAKCWLIGCGILLVLGIIVAVVGTLMCGRVIREAQQQAPGNQIDIWEPGEQGPSGEQGEEGSGGLGEAIGRLGELAEQIGAAAAATQIDGLDPSSLEPALLPTCYGFMAGLAADDPHAMYQWASDELKSGWNPDEWEYSEGWEHVSYELVSRSSPDANTRVFRIDEVCRDKSSGEETTLPWKITFVKSGDRWYADGFVKQDAS